VLIASIILGFDTAVLISVR